MKMSILKQNLKETPVSAILYDAQGKRQIYCDLKDIQEIFVSAKIRENGAANGFIEEKEVEQLYSKGELKFSCK